jgi:hypothetical protein
LKKKGVKFEWTSKCEESFQKLEDILKSAPILKIAYPYEDFVICTNACKDGIGGFLSQNYHVVCYESIKLKEHEKNYAKHDLELIPIVHALKIWRHYLMGRRFELRIDHYSLKNLFGQPTLNSRQTTWLEFLNEYEFEIKHVKGKEKQMVNALSRRAHETHISAINMFNTNLKDRFLETPKSYQQYLKIKETLKQGNLQQKIKYYELKEDGILMYKRQHTRQQIFRRST